MKDFDKREIAAQGDSEGWQLRELHAVVAELEACEEMSHERVSKWLSSWGKHGERKAPR